MHSAAASLTWEFWRRSLPNIALLVAGAAGLLSFIYMNFPTSQVHGGELADAAIVMHAALLAFLLPFAAVICCSAIDLQQRRFTLPVSSRALFGWPLLNGAVAMAAIYLMVALWANVLFSAGWTLARPVLAAIVLHAFCLALTLAVECPPNFRMMVTVLGAMAFAILTLFAQFPPAGAAFRPLWRASTPWDVVLAAALTAAAYLLGVAGISLQRQSRGISLTAIGRWLLSWLDFSWSGKTRLKSPPAAQFWWEWHEKGLGFPLVAAVVGLGVMLGFVGMAVFLPGRLDGQSALGVVFVWSWMMTVCSPFLGLMLGPTTQHFELDRFKATRPLTATQLADAVLKNMALGSLAGGFIWVSLTSLALALLATIDGSVYFEVTRIDEVLGNHPLTYVAIAFFALSVTMWTLMSLGAVWGLLRKWLFFTLLWVGVGGFLTLLTVDNWLPARWAEAAVVTCAWVLGIAWLAGAAAVFLVARRLRLIGRRRLLVVGGLFLLAYGATFWVPRPPAAPPVLFRLWLAAACTLPFFSWGAAPLALWWNRHR